MSSARFETVLKPDPRLRLGLLIFGGLAMLTGIAIIVSMPLLPHFRLPLACVWLAGYLRELRGLLRGAARVRLISLAALDDIVAIAADGPSQPLTLLPGSIVLSRLAWLRVRFSDGSNYVELLRGDPARDLEWQRLQLIWRLRRTVIGAQDGS